MPVRPIPRPAPSLRWVLDDDEHRVHGLLAYVDQDGRECHFLVPSRYDATRDDEELRKVQRQVNALAAKKRKRVKV